MVDIYDRNKAWINQAHHKFRDAEITLIGLGGLGSVLLQNLVGLGFRNFVGVDFDIIEISNLNRLSFATLNDVGIFKATVMERKCREINPEIYFRPLCKECNSPLVVEAINKSELVVSCLDNVVSRFECQYICKKANKTLIDLGTGFAVINGEIIGGGQVITVRPDGPCLSCAGFKIDFNEGYMSDEINLLPTSVVTLNMITAGLGAELIYKELVGDNDIIHLAFSLNELTIRKIDVTRDKDCRFCNLKDETPHPSKLDNL